MKSVTIWLCCAILNGAVACIFHTEKKAIQSATGDQVLVYYWNELLFENMKFIKATKVVEFFRLLFR